MIGRERMWKLESWITGAPGAFIAEVLIRAIYRTIRKDKATSAVFDPASSKFRGPTLWCGRSRAASASPPPRW